MKTKLLLLLLVILTISGKAQTFDWESVSFNGGFYVRQTVSGVQAECTNPSNNVEVLNGGGFAGSNANIITSTGNVSSVSVTFSTSINIQSIFAFDGNVDAAANWTFSPTGGTNSNVVQSIAASTGSTVTVNWTNVTGFTITSSSGLDRFSLDDIVFTIPVCLVNIPDANFKAYLVGNTAINTNGDTEIQCSEASAFTGNIYVYNNSIADLTGIEAFVNITYLYCAANSLTNLDVSNNVLLEELYCNDNQLTSLDMSPNTNLIKLNCDGNSLTDLNVANGNNSNFNLFYATNNPNLTCITVDDVAYSTANWTNIDAQTNFSLNCTLGTNEYQLQDITIYPNPVNNILNIQSEDALEKVKIFTIQGQKILETNNSNVNVSNLSSGLYLLKVYNQEGKVGVKRFIKK